MKNKCNKCKRVKSVDEFHKEARAKNGYKYRCAKCVNRYYNSMYPRFRIKKLKTAKRYYRMNRAKIIQRVKAYKPDPIRRAKLAKIRRKKNIDSIRAYMNLYLKKRRENPNFRLQCAMRILVWRLIKNTGNRTSEELGYSLPQLIRKLGRLPNKKETLDHKVPISWFVDRTQARIINHLDNLQILTRKRNSRKFNSFADPIPFSYYVIIRNHLKPQYIHKLTII